MTIAEIGTVIKVGDGIAEIYGLEKVMAGELLEFPHSVRGLVGDEHSTSRTLTFTAGLGDRAHERET